MKKILLEEEGIILFFGTMNAMPMMYAQELRKMGQKVVYFVDVAKNDKLSRPEYHFLDVKYPYPEWIIEFFLPSQLFISLFPYFTLRLMLNSIPKNLRRKKVKAVFMGGQFISFAKFLNSYTAKYYLSYGSDLENWCDLSCLKDLLISMRKKSIFQYLPKIISYWLLRKILQNNSNGSLITDAVLYFPKNMSVQGDLIVNKLIKNGVQYIPRYDISFDLFLNIDRTYKKMKKKLVIVSAVRFFYENIPDIYINEYKGNDKIIDGLTKYFKRNPNIEIHFFEKGPNVDAAKTRCKNLGLSQVIVWHKEAPLTELLKLYEQAHICFDQVGNHWVGAIGMYALYMGKSLIANTNNLGFLGDIPALNASTSEDIFKALVKLESPNLRKELYDKGKLFAEEKLHPKLVLNQLVE